MNRQDLLTRSCIEYSQGSPTLKESEVNQFLKQVSGWEVEEDGKSISKELQFKGFKETIEFVNRLADLAEQEQHHPDILIHAYKRLKITFSTHSIGGLSLNDFIMAAKTDKLLQNSTSNQILF